MNKPTIRILHRPTNTLLCADGVFRGFVSCCGSKDDTLLYRTVGHALRRLNSRKPGKRIREDMLKDCVLDVIEKDYGTTGKTYQMDASGKVVA
jgi:hypothetical protein